MRFIVTIDAPPGMRDEVVYNFITDAFMDKNLAYIHAQRPEAGISNWKVSLAKTPEEKWSVFAGLCSPDEFATQRQLDHLKASFIKTLNG